MSPAGADAKEIAGALGDSAGEDDRQGGDGRQEHEHRLPSDSGARNTGRPAVAQASLRIREVLSARGVQPTAHAPSATRAYATAIFLALVLPNFPALHTNAVNRRESAVEGGTGGTTNVPRSLRAQRADPVDEHRLRERLEVVEGGH